MEATKVARPCGVVSDVRLLSIGTSSNRIGSKTLRILDIRGGFVFPQLPSPRRTLPPPPAHMVATAPPLPSAHTFRSGRSWGPSLLTKQVVSRRTSRMSKCIRVCVCMCWYIHDTVDPLHGQQLSKRPARAAYNSTVLNRHAFTAADMLVAGEGA